MFMFIIYLFIYCLLCLSLLLVIGVNIDVSQSTRERVIVRATLIDEGLRPILAVTNTQTIPAYVKLLIYHITMTEFH